MPRIAAIDYGLKRIGVAISDPRARIALPLKVVQADKSLKGTIKNVLSALSSYEGEIKTILVGLPLLLNGEVGEMAQAAQRFAAALQNETKIDVKMFDERLSTVQTERSLKELSYSRKQRDKLVDSASAAILLQTYLDQTNEPT